jgi:glycosyltransferase involved in cell wall biosynthesis
MSAAGRSGRVKVMFLTGGFPHYFNLVLSRLNALPGIEVVVVSSRGDRSSIGEGVYQTLEGVDFGTHLLPETHLFPLYVSHRGLWRVLWKERPDIVVAPDNMFLSFILNPFLRASVGLLGIALVMKSIPLQVPTRAEWRERLSSSSQFVARLPKVLRAALRASRIEHGVRVLLLWLRAVAIRRADAHLCYVPDAIRIYGSYGVAPERIFVTFNSPDTESYAQAERTLQALPPILSANPYRIIHVGRLVKWKRVDLLLEAVALLQTEFPNVEVVVVGYGPEEEPLKERARTLGLDKSALFVGGVYSTATLGRYLQSAAVYVLAGMGGLSINDAMYFRLPIVCSVCDGTENVLVRDGKNGLLFRPGDVRDLADKIGRILRDPAMRQVMAHESRRVIDEEINIHTVLERYREAFDFVSPRPSFGTTASVPSDRIR